MHILPWLGLLSAGLAANVPAEAARQAVVMAEGDWRTAGVAGDTAFLERFHPAEARIQGMDGKVQSRAADIALVASGKIRLEFVDRGPLEIAIYGETAVVTGVDHLSGTAFGRYGGMFLRFTDVLAGRDGPWQLVVRRTTATSGF